MARTGVSYKEVVEAAIQLIGQGRNPTVEQVRLILGTGSSTTIANHLRQWRANQDATSLISVKENLPSEFVAMMKGLWERVINHSQEQVTKIEIGYQQTISELHQEVEKYKTNNQRWQKLYNQWIAEKNQLDSDKLTLDQALEFAHKENVSLHAKQDALTQQLQDREVRIDELHRLHKQTQENLEHYRESAREQRLLDQQKFDQEKQQYLLDIKKLNEELVLKTSHLSTLQQESQVLHQANQRFESANQQTQLKLDQLSETLKENEKAKTLFEKDSIHWQAECTHLKSQLKEKIDQASKLQVEARWLNQQLSDAKAQTDSLKDQNKLLANDKWALGQEKAQLEGQLKQLHNEIHA